MSWTDERIALLKKMWKEGKSAADIAKTLGKGVTRNAVIGKAHRMGLSNRPSPIKKPEGSVLKEASKKEVVKKELPKKELKAAPKKAVAPVVVSGVKNNPLAREAVEPRRIEKEVIPPGGGVALIDLTERMCKWPIGDPREDDFTFCGRGIRAGTPYCTEHVGMAYQSSGRTRPPPPEEKVVEDSADDEEEVAVT